MPSVIFLRAVNVVEPIFVERHCSRNQLAKFGVVNTGAAGCLRCARKQANRLRHSDQ